MSERADRIEARLDEIEARLDALEAKVPKCKAFQPPTVDQVYAYFTEHGGARLQADDFFDFYACKGWIVGKVKMKEWERAANRWIRNNKPVNGHAPQDRPVEDVRQSAIEERSRRIIEDARNARVGAISAKEWKAMQGAE